MRKILLVEDDEHFRAAIKNLLSKKYEVTEAPNGKVARDIISMTQFDLILSDIQMPHVTGVDLLEWVKKNHPTPMILMTGFAVILETQKAEELGADDFLPKPFTESDLREKIAKILKEDSKAGPQTPSAPIDLDKEFCKLPLEDFIAEKETDYGIYIRVSNLKYIKIAHKGGKLSEDKIKAFREKDVTHLYIRQEDFSKLIGFTLLVSKAVSSSGQVDPTKKMRFMKYTGEMIMQKAYVSGTDEALFRNAKDFLTTSMEVLTEDKETYTLLELLSNHTDHLYAHSLGVSIFSVMIAKQLGWQSPQNLFKLAFAGLFHDIGKKEIPAEILDKPRAILTQAERALLETHTSRGMEILQSLKTAPTEVVQVAYEHHEDILEQGYPQRLGKLKIHPFSLIVAVANTFCEYTIPSPQNPVARSADAAIQAILAVKAASLDPQAFEALRKVVHQMKEVA